VSTNGTSEAQAERTSVDMIAGLLASAALFFALLALAFHPLVVSVAAFLLGLTAAGMSRHHERLAGVALAVAGVCFIAGMAIAVTTHNSLW
jgi:membrane-bound ClpP family serine protease